MPDENDSQPSAEDLAKMARGAEWTDSMERPRALLTETDRKFLWDVIEYSHQNTAIDRRRGIRERVVHGLLDLSYLPMLEERDRERVFNELQNQSEYGTFSGAITRLIEFLYLGLDSDVSWFEETISHGIERAEYTKREGGRYGHPRVEVDIDVSPAYDLDDLEEQLNSGMVNTLSPAEVGALVRAGRVDPDDLDRLDFTNEETGPGPAFPSADDGQDDTENQ